ncbi:hypothetical protein HF086_003833 [Spodoptera exigua]|uniref:Uncharacterized protein n=1 Tax=Spodoptera exigua TaxID=7107 RepID=A0A922MXG4_SPOEX|nr:hypothetical protein HF086_003833 [Spodoptera exigua]
MSRDVTTLVGRIRRGIAECLSLVFQLPRACCRGQCYDGRTTHHLLLLVHGTRGRGQVRRLHTPELSVLYVQRKTCGIRAWVWVMSVLCVAALVCILVLVGMHGLSGSGSDIFLSFLEGLVFFGVMAYCILCVNSYYLMLKSAEDMEGPNKSVY